jgi:O-antigen/teichoic acid export membrane protein
MLGQTALGLYGNAWELANVPLEKVASLVTTVIPTYLSAVQNDPPALRRYLYGLTEVVALASFPACIGLGLVSREFVPLVLGHKWDGMIPALQVLSYYAAFRAIVAILPKVLTAVGKTHYVMWNDVYTLLMLPIAFYIGSYRGIAGIAWGWVLAYPLVVFPLYRKTFHTIGASAGDYFRALSPSLTGTVAMIPAVESVKLSFVRGQPLIMRLVLEVLAGALAYIFAVCLLHRERVRIVIRLAKNLIPSKTPAPQPSA